MVDIIHHYGCLSYVYTVNNAIVAEHLLKYVVDGLISDYSFQMFSYENLNIHP